MALTRGRRERGAVAVEMAIILPLLLLVVGGIVDFGRLLFTQNIVTNAAREGARTRALGYDEPTATARIDQAMLGVPSGTYTIAYTAGLPLDAPGRHRRRERDRGGHGLPVHFPDPGHGARPQRPVPDEVWRMRQRNERGAVGTIVGVLLPVGVVFGFLAISVDVGGLLWERRQLQNAADAAALSLATECAGRQLYANAGNLEGFVDSQLQRRHLSTGAVASCSVNIPGSGLPTCPALPRAGSLSECPGLPPASQAMTGLPYVEVRTESRTSAAAARWPTGSRVSPAGPTPRRPTSGPVLALPWARPGAAAGRFPSPSAPASGSGQPAAQRAAGEAPTTRRPCTGRDEPGYGYGGVGAQPIWPDWCPTGADCEPSVTRWSSSSRTHPAGRPRPARARTGRDTRCPEGSASSRPSRATHARSGSSRSPGCTRTPATASRATWRTSSAKRSACPCSTAPWTSCPTGRPGRSATRAHGQRLQRVLPPRGLRQVLPVGLRHDDDRQHRQPGPEHQPEQHACPNSCRTPARTARAASPAGSRAAS